MASFNKVILMGRLTANPELKQTPSNVAVTTFTIAVDRRFARQSEGGQTADFISVVAWRQTAEFVCRYFKKGSPILVCGSLQTRSWTDQQGGKRYVTEVVADEVTFVTSANQNGAAPTTEGAAYTPNAYGTPSYTNAETGGFEEITNDADLPF